MSYQKQLQFVIDLLSAMRIPTHLVQFKENLPLSELDDGLRSLIYGVDSQLSHLFNSLQQAEDNKIYRFEDEYFCHYLFFRFPESDQFFYIGPYLLNIPSREKINQKFTSIGKKESQMNDFYLYYDHLTLIEDENLLLTITNTLGCSIWGSQDNFTNEYIHYPIPDQMSPITSAFETDLKSDSVHLHILEEHYAAEKLLMDAVSQGKIHKISHITSNIFNLNIQPRIPDSIRNRKNYMIILNTLLRKAAEYGNVHPLHIDRISSSYARQIEGIKSSSESMNLMNEMIRNYCLLVKNHSISNYSYLIGRTITLINYDLKADLSLKRIAADLKVTPSYLSRLFKEEMKITLTEYVNQKRIEAAVTLLHTTDMQIQTIAYECGIQDTNYFIKLFKKNTGITPSKYRYQFVQNVK